MILQLEGVRLDIDVEATRIFQQKLKDAPRYLCDCLECQNYRQAIKRADEAALAFLVSLGIDPEHPIDITCYGAASEGILPCHAQALLVADVADRPLRKALMYSKKEGGPAVWIGEKFLPPSGFEETDFLPPQWLALTLEVHLPWVLETPHEDNL